MLLFWIVNGNDGDGGSRDDDDSGDFLLR